MKASRNGLFAACLLALGCAFEPAQIERAALASDPLASLDEALARLELSGAQRERIEALQKTEGAWIARLERARRAAETALREAEVRQPFDSARVGTLVRREAEISAYLRGTESRLVSAILALLEPAQRRAFARLRAGGAAVEDLASSAPAKPPQLPAQADPAAGHWSSL